MKTESKWKIIVTPSELARSAGVLFTSSVAALFKCFSYHPDTSPNLLKKSSRDYSQSTNNFHREFPY